MKKKLITRITYNQKMQSVTLQTMINIISDILSEFNTQNTIDGRVDCAYNLFDYIDRVKTLFVYHMENDAQYSTTAINNFKSVFAGKYLEFAEFLSQRGDNVFATTFENVYFWATPIHTGQDDYEIS